MSRPPLQHIPSPLRAWLLIAVLLFTSALAIAAPPAGSNAPLVPLKDLDGAAFELQSLAGRCAVLIFGELYHPQTLGALAHIDRALADRRLANEPVAPVLIIAQDLPPADLKRRTETLGFAGAVLHDRERHAFAAFRIAVMPTVVVLDPQQKVIHSFPSLTPRLGDLLADALLLAMGRLSPEQFQQALHPSSGGNARDEKQLRAQRTLQLARQLARRGLDDMAQQKYAEALQETPDLVEARLGMARLMLKNRRIADAEAQFRAVAALDPDSAEAVLGIAFVQTLRGGDELVEAERGVRELLARTPHPRGYYLLGLIDEQRDQHQQAASHFKRAASLLLERQGDQP